MSRWTVDRSTPGAATTSMASRWPVSPNSCWAVGSENAASVAPARLSAVPNRTMPVRVKVRGGPASRIRTCWPRVKWYFWAVPASMTTSSGVVGARPWARVSEEICWSGSKDSPRVGAPPVVMALPSGATNWAYPVTVPSAAATPGTPRTEARRDSGMALRTAPPPELSVKAAFPRTSKSMFW